MKHGSWRCCILDRQLWLRKSITRVERWAVSGLLLEDGCVQQHAGCSLPVFHVRLKCLPPFLSASKISGWPAALLWALHLLSASTSMEAGETTRFSRYRWAACFVNEMARFWVFRDVTFASGMWADSVYELFTFSGTPWSTVVPDCFPHILLLYKTNLSTLNPFKPTELTHHVLTNCQHVSLIMLAILTMLQQLLQASICPWEPCHCWDCIATIISGMKASNVHSHNILNFGKTDLQNSIKPGLNRFF